MKQMNARTKRKTERGTALLLVMFAVVLVSGLGVLMYFSSGTESRIDANYGGNLHAYYAARFGVEEVRDRVKYSAFAASPFANPAPNLGNLGIAELLPSDIAGNTGGVLYIVNPANGETVDPTNINNRYFDNQLCHDFNSGVAPGANCTVTPNAANWNLTTLNSVAAPGTALPYKWARVNMKTNRISYPYYVDGVGAPATLDTRICWDGFNEQLSPGGANPACDANGMRTVFMITSLAVTPGVPLNSARKLLRSEMVAPSIRPPGAITMDTTSASIGVSGAAIPTTAIDGRVHNIDGTLALTGVKLTDIYNTQASPNRCSPVAAVATDSSQASTQIAQGLSNLRSSIVTAANAACNANGSSISPNNCTPALWWVRGTDLSPRFTTTTTSGTSGTGTSGEHHDGSNGGSSGGSGSTTSTTGSVTSSLTGVTTTCDPASASCYANLDLTAPELLAVSATQGSLPHVPTVVLPPNPSSLFIGGSGNSVDPAIYQSNLPNTLPNEVKTLSALVALSAGQLNYTQTSVANLAANYGGAGNPAVVVITDPGLRLTQALTGFGILVVPNSFEIATSGFQWTGVVLVQGGAAQFVVDAGVTGSITGSVMLQPTQGTATAVQINSALPVAANPNSIQFRIAYSCDAIDMAFSSLPFKVISSSEFSF